jgi:DNA-binding CsgD family transcriptional regulator
MFELTPLQFEIASLMVFDMSDEQIAAALSISQERLEREIEAIEQELHARSRVGIVVAVLQNEIGMRKPG